MFIGVDFIISMFVTVLTDISTNKSSQINDNNTLMSNLIGFGAEISIFLTFPSVLLSFYAAYRYFTIGRANKINNLLK